MTNFFKMIHVLRTKIEYYKKASHRGAFFHIKKR